MTLINFITQIFFLLIYLPVLLNFVDSHSSSSVNLLCMLPQISMLLSQWFYECSFSFSFSNNSTEACLISSWLFMSSRSLLFSITIYLIYQAAVFFSAKSDLSLHFHGVRLNLGFSQHFLMEVYRPST